MASKNQKQHDPTGAFLLNGRQQKLLYIKLEKIDKQWCNQLRLLSRDRLETTSELIRLEDEKSQLEYFDETMETHRMREYTDVCLKNMKELKRELTHDNFNFDNHSAIHMKRNPQLTNLPKLDGGCFVTKSYKSDKKVKKPNKNRLKKRRKSNLLKSKIFSMSDSNLDKVSKYKRENSEIEDNDTKAKDDSQVKKNAKQVQRTQLPDISEKISVKRSNEQYRYLREKMATALVLPTVQENTSRQRKLSI